MTTPLSQNHIDSVVQTARRRQLAHQALLGLFALMAALNAALALRILLTGAWQAHVISLLSALSLTIGGILLLRRLWRAGRREMQRMHVLMQPGAAAIEDALAATRAHIDELKRFRAITLILLLPLFAIALGSLYAEGKMLGAHVLSFALLLTVVVAGLMGVIHLRLKQRLEPQVQHLTDILAQYDAQE